MAVVTKWLSRAAVIAASAAIVFSVAPSAPASDTKKLSVRDVGEYGGIPWGEPGKPVDPGSRLDRVRDLSFSVAKLGKGGKLKDDISDEVIDEWARKARWGREQNKKLLLQLYFWDGMERVKGEIREVEVYWKRLDRFLGGIKSRGALGDFLGVVLAEENVAGGGRTETLAELYRRIKAKYEIAVWQWWVPYPSSGWIPADGWVVDAYFKKNPTFRQYIRKYVVTGLPVVIMPWAAAEHPSAYRNPITPERWKGNYHQLDVAVEFNLPVAFYWTFRGGTSFEGNRGAPKTEIDKINHWIWNYIKRVHRLPRDYSGLKSADYGVGRKIDVGANTENGKLVYQDDFSKQKCIDDAAIAGFRDFLMDGKTLVARGFQGRRVNAELTYHFAGEGYSVRYPAISIRTITNRQLKGRVEAALSSDGKTWPCRTSVDGAGEKILDLSSASDEKFASLSEFWVRVRMTGDPGSQSAPPAGIDDLRIEAAADAPSPGGEKLKTGTQ